jgi:hypothetical protein
MDELGDRGGNRDAWYCGPYLTAPRRAALEKGDLKPHLVRYWLTPPEDPQLDAKVADICTLYQDAPALAEQGERVVSTDALTGVAGPGAQGPGVAAGSREGGAPEM